MQLTIQLLSNGEREFESLHHVATIPEFDQLDPVKCNDSKLMTIWNYKELWPKDRGIHGTHLPVDMIFRDATSNGRHGPRYVVMMRNPMDVLVSMQSQMRKLLSLLAPMTPSLEDLYSQTFTRVAGGYFKYNLAWWQLSQQHPQQVIFLFYEDAISKPAEVIHRTMKFLDVSLDDAALERVRFFV
ncbi:unnamed protein product [Durusdinium trenchii]|uniref:Sulfotransferase domain-containing protein n=1 Tax=Durusdinium trenchii TaxID=1381693 RepID=A0ABP0L7Z7_9DINO